MTASHENPAFIGENDIKVNSNGTVTYISRLELVTVPSAKSEQPKSAAERQTWGKGVEFLMSCIAMSVGLGNVWRFPFTALENGGGAFLIPYLVVLFLVGKPIYYLEMIIGQFSSRGSVKIYDLCPALRGVGIGQVYSISLVTTYYVATMGITLHYLYDSFKAPLPWSQCQSNWPEHCLPSGVDEMTTAAQVMNQSFFANGSKAIASAELYFTKEVMHERTNIDDGIGIPNASLVVGLFLSCLSVFIIISRGVKSSGKASYFLAIFPYIILGVLLIRALTLPGSWNGILYFIRPDWQKILEPKVWYAAVTQCFYSLSVCFGNVIVYASYNKFKHNVHRDAMIVTTLDTFTSLLAGFTIFGILGHLAHEIGSTDVGSVVKAETGLAFISYPDAIAKFKSVPQIFSVLFFLMLFTLGLGTNIAMTSCTVTGIRDNFPKLKQWHCAAVLMIVSFCIGLMYITPGGQQMIKLVDFFGASMIALMLGIVELLALGWIYGIDRLIKDAEFMMGRKVGLYWRICWSVITPLIMIVIFLYFIISLTPLTYDNVPYPTWALALGWCLTCIGIAQLPIWIIIAIVRQPGVSWSARICAAFKPKADWGPADVETRLRYQNKMAEEYVATDLPTKVKRNILG